METVEGTPLSPPRLALALIAIKFQFQFQIQFRSRKWAQGFLPLAKSNLARSQWQLQGMCGRAGNIRLSSKAFLHTVIYLFDSLSHSPRRHK